MIFLCLLHSVRYQLNEEIEKRTNSELLANKTKEQLARKEEQYTEYEILL